MKITSQESDIEISANLTTSQFQIAQTRHTFQLLSSGLYSDKYLAVVRELSCNAWDSHQMNGNPKEAFEVHLPMPYGDPTFRVRDYGTGLSHEDVVGLYSTYMASSKQGSNKQTGCFGLGSKSPFAVTDTFTVTSWFGGEKIVFVATIDANGLPNLTHLVTTPSEERTGLEVSFRIAPNTQSLYQEAAEAALRPFSPRPKVFYSGDTNPAMDFSITPAFEQTEVISGDNFALYPRDWRNDTSLLTMGNVDYKDKLAMFTTSFKWLKGHVVHLKCPIGTFEITPSRETVQWTDHTEAGLRSMLMDVDQALHSLAAERMKDAECKYDASLIAGDLSSLQIKFEWNGEPVKVSEHFGGFKYQEKRKITTIVKDANGKAVLDDKGQVVQEESWDDFDTFAQHRKLYHSSSMRDGSYVDVCSSDFGTSFRAEKGGTQFVIARGKSVSRRLMHAVREEECGTLILVGEQCDTPAKVAKAFCIPEDRVVYSDAFPLPPAKPRKAKATVKFTAAKVVKSKLVPNEVTIADGGVYANLNYSQLRVSSSCPRIYASGEASTCTITPQRAYEIHHKLSKLAGVEALPIIATRAKLTRKLAAADNWIEWGEHVRDLLQKAMANLDRYMVPHKDQDWPSERFAKEFLTHLSDVLPSDLVAGLELEAEALNNGLLRGDRTHNHEVLGMSWVPDPKLIVWAVDQIRERYPLLGQLGSSYLRGVPHWVEYIRLIDKERGNNVRV